MLAIIDGDYIPYYCASSSDVEDRYYYVAEDRDSPHVFTSKKKGPANKFVQENPEYEIFVGREVKNEDVLYHYLDAELKDIIAKSGCDEYILTLGGKTSNDYRRSIYPEYKAKRGLDNKPALLTQAKQYLVDIWGAHLVEYWEADDEVAILYNENPDSVLCSNDKDTDQVPGRHMNTAKRIPYYVEEQEALQNLYMQILTGDATDNIPGVWRVGPVKAARALEGLQTEKEMWDRVVELHGSEESANLTAQLVYLLRSRDDAWHPPIQD